MKDNLKWLMEPADIGGAYLAARDLMDTPPASLAPLRTKAHREGPIAQILEKMQPEGYWVVPGPGYNPKYTSTVWSMILLGQLGASIEEDPRLAKSSQYLLENALGQAGQFTWKGTSSCTIDCLQGNLCTALLDMGCQDPRLEAAMAWMAHSQTGRGLAPLGDTSTRERYYATGKCGPNFACSATNKESCAWGAVKVLLAFARYPDQKRTPEIQKAIRMGVDFLFGPDPVTAAYPTGTGAPPSGVWWKFGFPLFYGTDLLQLGEALVGLGYSADPRLANTFKFIADQQDEQGRWKLRHHYNGKTWIDAGKPGAPNKWVTLRALKLLRLAGRL
jgi:hypothetical protein